MSMFDSVKRGLSSVVQEKGVPVPVFAGMLQEVIGKNEKLEDIKVSITKGEIVVTGKTEADIKIMKKSLSFSISLLPTKMENRELHFKITKLKPLNLSILNKRIFDKPPHLTYKSGHIKIDFNSWDIVRKIPIGHIRNYKMEEGKIILVLGL